MIRAQHSCQDGEYMIDLISKWVRSRCEYIIYQDINTTNVYTISHTKRINAYLVNIQ